MLSVSGYRGIEIKEYDDENRRRTDEELENYRIVRPGQLVVNTMWMNYAGLGVSALEGHVSPAYRCYWISNEIEENYAHHLMRSSIYVEGYKKFLTGIRPNSLQMGTDDLRALPILLPPREEQKYISRFLDHETAKIDALVEEQKRLIALLKEKRQAVISHAVTKGLDPKVPMKDSEVEWIGQVPAHWLIGPLRWYAAIQGGIAKGKEYSSRDNLVSLPYLRVANVQNGYVDLAEVAEISVLPEEAQRYALRDGDVLMNEGGDNDKLGRGAVWRAQIEPCLHQNHVFAIRPNYHLSADWLSWFTSSDQARSYFYLYSKQSTNLASISSSNIMSCPLPLPPPPEQAEIIRYIEESVNQLDALMDEVQATTNLLNERRAALISAAVTGKIDVRNWQPSDSSADIEQALPMAAEEPASYG